VRRTVEAARAIGLRLLTLYAFSSDNWQRPRPEVSALFSLLSAYLRDEAGRLAERGIRLSVLGRRDRLPASLAAEIESAVVDQLRGLLRAPEIIIATWRAARLLDGGITEAEVREALLNLDPVWDELFPAEQTRIIQLLVERVEVHPDGLNLKLRVDGL